jgi:hypothetical protein
MMRVGQAKALARQWVAEEAGALPGFAGAFYHGSATWLPDDAELPASSDLDVMVALDEPPRVKLGKFVYHGVLLEISYLPAEQLESAERVLGSYHLAGSFRAASVIADPSGQLVPLQAAVARGYARRRWVRARCEDAQNNILRHLRSLDQPAPFHDHVTGWLFAAGVTTHVLLVAGMRNPTVRRRYVAARELLADYGRLDFHEELLELLGCRHMSRERALQHLAALAELFDAASEVIATPFPFATDLSQSARPIAIDGSRELIAAGLQREAVFWLVATACRCLKVLHHDAPAELERFRPAFHALVGDLGIASPADLPRRGEEVRAFLPRLWREAEAIMAANPAIEDDEQ